MKITPFENLACWVEVKNFFPVSQRKKLIFQVAHASHKRAKAATAVYKKLDVFGKSRKTTVMQIH